ncbi:MAG TPA: hypothetical protein VHJ83_06515 [Micromonosporaceae bacterium]|nr:hypothetical protein [Micromonosporaceae bacterium]
MSTRRSASVSTASHGLCQSTPDDGPEAVALAALRHADLPVAELDGPARK